MNHNEEVPDFLGGLGDMLPADVLKKVNELLERVHRKDKDHQGSTVINIYEKGSMHIDRVDKQIFYGDACPRPTQPQEDKAPPTLPPPLSSPEAMALWNRKNMYRDYYKALSLQQSLDLQDRLDSLFG